MHGFAIILISMIWHNKVFFDKVDSTPALSLKKDVSGKKGAVEAAVIINGNWFS